MTTIAFDLRDVLGPVDGLASVRPYAEALAADHVQVESPGDVVITGGVGSVDVAADLQRYWWIRLVIDGVSGADRLFDVPDQDDVTHRDLIEDHEVDPDSLDPAEPLDPAWVAQLADVVADLGDVTDDLAGLDAEVAALDLALADVEDDVAALTPGAWVDVLDETTNVKFVTTPQTPQYRRFAGFTELAGRITVSPAGVSVNDVIGTVDAAACPPAGLPGAGLGGQVYNATNGNFLRVSISSAGAITIGTASATAAILYLDGIRWRHA